MQTRTSAYALDLEQSNTQPCHGASPSLSIFPPPTSLTPPTTKFIPASNILAWTENSGIHSWKRVWLKQHAECSLQHPPLANSIVGCACRDSPGHKNPDARPMRTWTSMLTFLSVQAESYVGKKSAQTRRKKGAGALAWPNIDGAQWVGARQGLKYREAADTAALLQRQIADWVYIGRHQRCRLLLA
eukprot:scaffold163435_cov18-Tisochrysis_lutea.AAC.1